MIDWISGWAEAIIVVVIIATIIEMILPEGSCKKYIKVVIGVYILFTIISPVISKFTGKSLAVSDMLDLNKYINEVKEKESTQNILQEENAASIRDIYIGNLKADIKNKLKGKGYITNSIELDVGYDDNYTLNKIELSIVKEEENTNFEGNDITSENVTNEMIETVNEINISITNQESSKTYTEKNRLNNSEKNKMKEYLSGIYEINEKNIIIY